MPKLDYLYEVEEYDEFDSEDAILIEQGNCTDCIEIEEGEVFEIPHNFLGEIDAEKDIYILREEFHGHYEKELINGVTLYEGRYVIEGDILREIYS